MTTHYDPYPRQAAPPTASVYVPTRATAEHYAPAETAGDPEPGGLRVDGLAVAALVIVAFLILQSVLDRDGGEAKRAELENAGQAAGEITLSPEGARNGQERTQEQEMAPPPQLPAPDPHAISYPYDDYWLTQGPHGFSYGHMAIDLAAGKGAPIKSPIHGQVTANYVDQYGNTTLTIENDVYLVTLLHGNYSAKLGQQLALGEVVGSEGNNGYTTDMQGRSCRGRDCGYHSHLNVYSKITHSNVNPLDVLQ